jgi:hypothetical protein
LDQVLGVLARAAQRPGRAVQAVEMVAEGFRLEVWGHVAWTLSEVGEE